MNKTKRMAKPTLFMMVFVLFCNEAEAVEKTDDTILKTYTNSLCVPVADPFVFFENGTYYLYGTDEQRGSSYGFPVYTSTDMVDWEDQGYAFSKTATTWAQNNFWGPEVIRVGNDYYMYFNGSPNKKPGTPFNMHLCIAKGKSPLGPFEELEAPFYKAPVPDEVIDQNIFIDDDGKPYLVFTQVTFGRNDIRVVKLKDNLTEFDGEPVLAIIPTQEWESRAWNGHKVTEGGYLFKRDTNYYILYTANDFRDPSYSIGYATSKTPLGPWKKYDGNPILSKTNMVHGPGNGMFVKSPDGKETFIVYHTHCKPGQVSPRQVAIDRVRFKEVKDGPDIIIIDGPTSTPQPVPSATKQEKLFMR